MTYRKFNPLSYDWFNKSTARSTTVVTCGICRQLYCPKVGHRCSGFKKDKSL